MKEQILWAEAKCDILLITHLGLDYYQEFVYTLS